jgi:hypothetical protein
MNRTERLYALVEELRAAGPRGRTARRLAAHFEVSVRTIERDLSALGQAGVPLATKTGRAGGYTLDRSMSLPPLNFTPREAAAVAVALSRSEHVLFARDARSALQKIVAAMPERALAEARSTADKVIWRDELRGPVALTGPLHGRHNVPRRSARDINRGANWRRPDVLNVCWRGDRPTSVSWRGLVGRDDHSFNPRVVCSSQLACLNNCSASIPFNRRVPTPMAHRSDLAA